MGKGTIILNSGAGKYNVTSEFFPDRLANSIARLDAQIIIYEAKVAAETKAHLKNLLKSVLFGLQKQKTFLEAQTIEAEDLSSVWCADLTENLSGDVGLIEVPGESVSYNIQPGHNSGATYSTTRDGQLVQTITVSPEAAFYNLAMLPGWQKWKPTFRYATINSISGSLAEVTLEAATSSQQSIDINQTKTMADVPFEYMDCDEKAFTAGDVVLIKFTNQAWTTPEIVGFKENPKACGFYILVTSGIHATVFDILKNEVATNILKNDGDPAIFPCLTSDISDFILLKDAFGTDILTSTAAPSLELTPLQLSDLDEYFDQPFWLPGNPLSPNPTPIVAPGENYLGATGVENLTAEIRTLSIDFYPDCDRTVDMNCFYPRGIPDKNDCSIYRTQPVFGIHTRDFQDEPKKIESWSIISLTDQSDKKRCIEASVDIDFDEYRFYCEDIPEYFSAQEYSDYMAVFNRNAGSESIWAIKMPFHTETIIRPVLTSVSTYSMPDFLALPYWQVTTNCDQLKQKRRPFVDGKYSNDKMPYVVTLCVLSYETSDLNAIEYDRDVFDSSPPIFYYIDYNNLTETNVQKLNYVRAFIDETTPGTYMDTDIYDMTPNLNLKAAVESLCNTDNTGDIEMKFLN